MSNQNPFQAVVNRKVPVAVKIVPKPTPPQEQKQ
jgi:hypothetical protein